MIDVVKAHFNLTIPGDDVCVFRFLQSSGLSEHCFVARLNGEGGKPHFVIICENGHTKNSNLILIKKQTKSIFPKEA